MTGSGSIILPHTIVECNVAMLVHENRATTIEAGIVEESALRNVARGPISKADSSSSSGRVFRKCGVVQLHIRKVDRIDTTYGTVQHNTTQHNTSASLASVIQQQVFCNSYRQYYLHCCTQPSSCKAVVAQRQ
jgi:hypothetical protein